MTIHLRAPGHNPKGPDGKGWNRLSLNAHIAAPGDQCALRPRSYPTLVESQDTRRARWGGFGRCVRDNRDCGNCPILQAAPRRLDSFTDRVLVRVEERVGEGLVPAVDRRPWLMNRPEQGWASFGYPWTWEQLSRVEGWVVGDAYRDEHSEGFWLVRVEGAQP